MVRLIYEAFVISHDKTTGILENLIDEKPTAQLVLNYGMIKYSKTYFLIEQYLFYP
jgi:hypothetical protein